MLLRHSLAGVLCGLAALASDARAQEGRELNNALKDVVHIWTAPAHLDAGDLPGVAALAGATGAAMLVDEPIHEWLRAHPDALPARILTPFREGGPANMLGRSYFLVATSGVLYLAGAVGDDVGLRNAGRGCGTSVLATTVSRHVVARLLGRERPRANKGAFVIKPIAWGDWPMRSFPGGHGANAMSCASFWNQRFDLGAAEPVLYGLAAAVGAGRIVDEAHWTSDTVFGLGYGYAIGREVALQQRKRDRLGPAAQMGIGLSITF